MTSTETELVKLVASGGANYDQFGSGVSVSGNLAIVGAWGYGGSGKYKGSAYIYELSNGTWTQKQRLLPSDPVDRKKFGHAVAISGDYAIIGAPGNMDSRGRHPDMGAAYIFERQSNGTWIEKQKIQGHDTEAYNNFGESVAISGDYAIIGAPSNKISYSLNIFGCAYIFKRNSTGSWSEKAQLQNGSDASESNGGGGKFGYRVGINGNYAIIGAPEVDGPAGVEKVGCAYIFEHQGNDNWSEKQILRKSGTDEFHARFGISVGISSDYAIVGAFGSDENGFSSAGSAYIFKNNNGSFGNRQKIVASDPSNYRNIGFGVAISNDYAIIAGPSQTTGHAYIFELSNGSWTEKFKCLATDGVNGDYLGGSVAISNGYAFASAMRSNTYKGSTYVYQLGPSVSTEEKKLISLSVQTADIDVLRAVAFSNKSNGKGDADATSRGKIKALMSAASSAVDKRRKRRAALKFLFSLDTDVTKMVIPKADLDLPAGFKKAKALVLKAGQTMAVSDLAAGEGFYSVLDDGEDVTITTDNTSLTFTRGDVGDNELYTVSATTWTDVTINTDEVSGGNFAENNNTGTLAPGDIVAIDGRKFIIGSVADGGSAASGGDPYVFPMKSNCPVKLPNKPAVYRMFEQGNNYVNVEVAEATEEHKRRMIDYASKLTPVTHNVVTDGYFYSKAFISAEGHQLTLDYASREVNTDESSMDFFTIKQGKNTFDCGDFKEEAKCWTVGWTTSEGKRIEAKLLFFSNPHLENGVSVVPSTLKNSTGLIVDNYKPKLMELPSLTTEKFGKLHRRLAKAKNMRQKINIKGKNEKWVFN